MNSKRIGVLGGGLSGISKALELEGMGHKVHLVESADQLGGVIQSVEKDGFLLDYGANTLSLRLERTAKTLDSCGALPHALEANPEANKRFIVREGQLIALPTSPLGFFGSQFLSPLGKSKATARTSSSQGKSTLNESVAEFIVRRLGKEALDYCMNPFVSGVYASKPESLSLAHAFPSLMRMENEHRSLLLGLLSKNLVRDGFPKLG